MLAVRNREIKENITFLGHLHFDCQCISYWCLGAITSEVCQFFALCLEGSEGSMEWWSGGNLEYGIVNLVLWSCFCLLFKYEILATLSLLSPL